MLDAFEAWFSANDSRLREEGFEARVVRPPQKSDRNGVFADVDTERYAARVTVWDSGECDEEVLDFQSGETLYWKHNVFADAETLQAALDEFFTRLSKHEFGVSS